MMINFAISAVLAYLIGSISSAIIVCKIMGLPDPRDQGSLNPGTTNVYRIGGRVAAYITLVSDILKGVIPVLITHYAFHVVGTQLAVVAVLAVLGHIYPVFFKFQGGKGVATAIGALIALTPMVAAGTLLIWLIVFVLLRYVSLASMIAAIAAPSLAYCLHKNVILVPITVMSIMIIYKHEANIQRLFKGEERKMHVKKC